MDFLVLGIQHSEHVQFLVGQSEKQVVSNVNAEESHQVSIQVYGLTPVDKSEITYYFGIVEHSEACVYVFLITALALGESFIKGDEQNNDNLPLSEA